MAAWCSVNTSDHFRVASLVWICATLLRKRNNLMTSIVMRSLVNTYMMEMGSM